MKFVNAQEMAFQHPETFHAPSPQDLARLQPGDNVKVCVANERFWCWVLALCGEEIIGIINNDLVNSHIHCLVCGDAIRFGKKNIFQILK
jgi:hypothetical protein